MQFTNTLNNHPKNKRKKNYYHTSNQPLPLIIQSSIKDEADPFLNRITDINLAINQYPNSGSYLRIAKNVLNNHLKHQTDKDFFEKNKSDIRTSDLENNFKQNKNIELIKNAVFELKNDYSRNNNAQMYIDLLNKYHLIDPKLEQQLLDINNIDFLKNYSTYVGEHPQLKRLRDKHQPVFFKHIPSILDNLKAAPIYRKSKFIYELLKNDYALSYATQTIKDFYENADDRVYFDDIKKLTSQLLEKQFKTNEIIETFLSTPALTPFKRIELCEYILERNPELFISHTNNDIEINPHVYTAFNNFSFDINQLAQKNCVYTTALNLDHHLKQKTYKHLTKKQMKTLKKLVHYLKNENSTTNSPFSILYENSYESSTFSSIEEIIDNTINAYTFNKNEIQKSIDDANYKIKIELDYFHQELGDYNSDEIDDDYTLSDIFNECSQSSETFDRAIMTLTNHPYRFYEIFNEKLNDELKVITIENKKHFDKYQSTKEIKSLLQTINDERSKSNNTLSIIAQINPNAFATSSIISNECNQKQPLKYLKQTQASHLNRLQIRYNQSNYEDNRHFKQAVQQSINPHQQFYLNHQKRIFEHYGFIKESILKNKDQYSKQLINALEPMQQKIVQQEGNPSIFQRQYIDKKIKYLSTIIPITSNKEMLNQFKNYYQSFALDNPKPDQSIKDETLSRLNRAILVENTKILDELLHHYQRQFKLVEPIVTK